LANVGQIDMSIQAMKKAIELNGSNPEWYQLIAKLYNQKGEAAYANMYNNLAQEKINSMTPQN
jgi:predicted Zn-dependent protease